MPSRTTMIRLALTTALTALVAPLAAADAPAPPPPPDAAGRPRLIVLSDIGNEPDDQMSLVRLLLYTDEIDVEGLIATTSVWQRTATHPETMRAILDDYARVRPNLLRHATGWPEAAALRAVVSSGQPGYGMAATGAGRGSPGAAAIIRAADRPDPRPLWIGLWGGANTLAQALQEVRATRSPAELAAFVAKLRVYSISDQDDAGPWIRRSFPGLSFIVSPSSPDGEEYRDATWTGISGDVFYRNGEGADGRTVTNAWLDGNIRAKGPLGRHYPRFQYIMEGDTPAFLGLIDNGLESYRSPSWGGWGGRYVWRTPRGETHPVWTQGGDLFVRTTSQDTLIGADGRPHSSDQATIWRWRTAFQNDFAARMDWTVAPYARANHPPRVTVNGRPGTGALTLDARVGEPLVLDAAGTRDPDGQRLHYRWFAYPEAGYSKGVAMAAVAVAGADTPRATVTPTAACRPEWLPTDRRCEGGVAHLILAVTDEGTPALTRYRRVILRVR